MRLCDQVQLNRQIMAVVEQKSESLEDFVTELRWPLVFFYAAPFLYIHALKLDKHFL